MKKLNSIKIEGLNGIKENTVLNELANSLDNTQDLGKHVKSCFELGVNGIWEFIITNTRTDKGLVLCAAPNKKHKTACWVYSTSVSTQPKENEFMIIKDKDLKWTVKTLLSKLS